MNTQTKAERIAYWIVFITTIAAGAFAVAYITLLTGCAGSGQRQLAASGEAKLETVNAYLRASAPSPTPAPISEIEEFEQHRSTNNPALGEGVRLGYGLAPAPLSHQPSVVSQQLTAAAVLPAPDTNGVIELGWKPSADPSITNHYIANITTGGRLNVPGVTSATLQGLLPGKSYLLTVLAQSRDGHSYDSNYVLATAVLATKGPRLMIWTETIGVAWQCVPGLMNILQQRISPTTGTWEDILSFVGTNGVARVLLSATNAPQSFYRVRIK